MQKERRQSPRVRLRLTTTFKLLRTGKVLRALTKNVGAGGLCLITDELLEPGSPLELEVHLPDRPAPVRCVGEVVWSRPIESTARSYEQPAETGVKFTSIDPADRSSIMQFAAMNAMSF